MFDYLTDLDDEYRPRNVELMFIPNGEMLVKFVFKDDSPGCQSRRNPDIPWSFRALNIPDAKYWSEVKREVSSEFHEFLRKTGLRRN